jgi:hypothetical protein
MEKYEITMEKDRERTIIFGLESFLPNEVETPF